MFRRRRVPVPLVLMAAGSVVLMSPGAAAATRSQAPTSSASVSPDPRNRPPVPAQRSVRPQRPAQAKPFRNLPDSRRPARPVPAKVSPGVRRLLGDWEAGVLGRDAVVRIALGKLGYGTMVPTRYRDPRLTQVDVQALTLAGRSQVRRLTRMQQTTLAGRLRQWARRAADGRPRAAATTNGCGIEDVIPSVMGGTVTYRCRVSSDHFDVDYNLDGEWAIANGAQALEVGDTLERAYSTYAALGYRMPRRVRVVYGSPNAQNDRAVTVPEFTILGFDIGGIYLPVNSSRRYLPAHEFFHAVQYEYFPTGAFSGSRILDSISNINWWMEATAEWASKQVVASDPLIGDERYTYALRTPAFLASPTHVLAAGEGPAGIGGDRNYGAVVFAEWLSERLGKDVIRRTWEETADDVEIDASSDLIDTLHDYSLDPGDVVADFWDSAYQICDGPSSAANGSLRFQDPDVLQWCTKFLASLKRPDDPVLALERPGHAFIDVAAGGERDDVIGGGGADFIDLASGVARQRRQVSVEVTPSIDAPLRVRLMQWSTSPATRCVPDQDVRVTAAQTLRLVLELACPHATLMVVNPRLEDNTGTNVIVRVASQLSAAVVSNGVVRLGVNAAGDLDVAGAEPSSGTGTTYLGLRYVPTNADALAPGCLCEGWGIAWTDSGGVQHHAYANESQGGMHGMTVVSFTSDGVSASSVVDVDGVRVHHDIHPSSDPHLYEIDMSIEPGPASDYTFTYRRVMDFDAEPTAFEEYMTVHPKDAGAMHVLFSSDDGFASADPTAGPSSILATGSFTDSGPTDHGALFDFAVGTLGLRMYYGAAESATAASAALTAVDAATTVLAKPSTPGNPAGGEPNTFVFGSSPGRIFDF